MAIINNEYYIGFEGEPEIQFICKKKNNTDIVIIWEGYFDEIMRLITPEEKGWTGLAYYYNMCFGWYEETPWVIEDLQVVLDQLKKIDSNMLSSEASKVLKIICNMLKEALDNSIEVCIARE